MDLKSVIPVSSRPLFLALPSRQSAFDVAREVGDISKVVGKPRGSWTDGLGTRPQWSVGLRNDTTAGTVRASLCNNSMPMIR